MQARRIYNRKAKGYIMQTKSHIYEKGIHKKAAKTQLQSKYLTQKKNPFLCVLSVIRARLFASILILIAIVLTVHGRHLKVAALPGSHLVDIHPVKFFQGTAFTLDDEEVNDESSDKQAASEDVTICKINGASNKGSEESDEEVPEPIGCGGESHTLRTILGGEQFGGNGPDHRPPSHSIGGDKEASDDDHSLAGSGGVFGVLDVEHEVADGGEDHEANEHKAGTEDQGLATTEVLDDVQATEGSTEVDCTENDLGDEAVGDTGTLEYSRALLGLDVRM
jgi:hypothetical protein